MGKVTGTFNLKITERCVGRNSLVEPYWIVCSLSIFDFRRKVWQKTTNYVARILQAILRNYIVQIQTNTPFRCETVEFAKCSSSCAVGSPQPFLSNQDRYLCMFIVHTPIPLLTTDCNWTGDTKISPFSVSLTRSLSNSPINYIFFSRSTRCYHAASDGWSCWPSDNHARDFPG